MNYEDHQWTSPQATAGAYFAYKKVSTKATSCLADKTINRRLERLADGEAKESNKAIAWTSFTMQVVHKRLRRQHKNLFAKTNC